MMNQTMSKKQLHLINLIKQEDVPKIRVLGSTQSGKTYSISFGTILYAQEMDRLYPDEKFFGAIIGWNSNALKRNVVEVIETFLQNFGFIKGKTYELKWTQNEKYLRLYNMTFYFFAFYNVLSFNTILGSPLIFIWVDESARIYTQQSLQEQFDQLPGRQMSYIGHPMFKEIHSFNVEGNDNHPYKIKYLKSFKGKYLEFFPWDNPRIDTENKVRDIINLFPTKTLREQKVYNKWVVSEGRVFNKINKIASFKELIFKEIGIGIDYGSTNATTFVPIALCYHQRKERWILVRLDSYYHNSQKLDTTPTTEFFSKQLRLFLLWLRKKYPRVPIYDIVIDSEAKHYINRLDTDNIANIPADKYPGSVKEGVEYMQSLRDKEYLYDYVSPSIEIIHDDLSVELSDKDEVLIETEGYRYDKQRTIKTGVDCYVKENDHSQDGERYLLLDWKEKGKAPVV